MSGTTFSSLMPDADSTAEMISLVCCLTDKRYAIAAPRPISSKTEAALAQRLARLEPRRLRVLHCRDANRETHGESILLAERLPVRQR